MEELIHFLNYYATNPDASIIFRRSDMILTLNSDAAYLNAPKARNRAGGYHYLGNRDGKLFNGPIYILAKVIKAIMSAASEAECGALFINAQKAIPARITLEELKWKQPPTPMHIDNNTASSIMNNTVKQKISRTINMQFYWLQNRVNQGMSCVYWGQGNENLADYYTKRFAPTHHKNVRLIYLYVKDRRLDTPQGCVRILAAPTKSPKLHAIENTTTKPANLPVTRLTNLEHLYNSRIRLPAVAAAMVRLVNRLSKKCTQ